MPTNPNNANIKLFEKLVKSIDRDRIEILITWLREDTDFYIAPASTRYHGAEEGGLLRHSLCVYKNLLALRPPSVDYSLDTLKIVSLFHDLCKTNFYSVSTKNRKNPETGTWETVPYYTVDEQLPYGSHGGKSVYLLMSHGLSLTPEEVIAINNHMGAWDYTTYHNPSNAFDKYPLAVYLHVADIMATYIDKM